MTEELVSLEETMQADMEGAFFVGSFQLPPEFFSAVRAANAFEQWCSDLESPTRLNLRFRAFVVAYARRRFKRELRAASPAYARRIKRNRHD